MQKLILKRLLITTLALFLVVPAIMPIRAAGSFVGLNIVNGYEVESGMIQYLAKENSEIFIKANAAPVGMVFDSWKSSDSLTIINPKGEITPVLMPQKNSTITATYKKRSINEASSANEAVTMAKFILTNSFIEIVEGRNNNLISAAYNIKKIKDLGVTLSVLDRDESIKAYVDEKGLITYKDIEGQGYIELKISKPLANENSVMPMVFIPAKNDNIIRLSGKSREETAVKVSLEVYENSKNVILVGYNGDVDALAATLLAKDLDAPLLITHKERLSYVSEKEIERLQATKAYLIGGEGIISKQVETKLKTMGLSVERIAGSNRYDTAAKIAQKVKAKDLGMPSHAFVVLGQPAQKNGVLADALAIGPVSAMHNIPILLVSKNRIPKETLAVLDLINIQEITIIGGTSVVSEQVENELKQLASYVTRISGASREKTALKIAETYFKQSDTAIFVYGHKSADALTGGYYGNKIIAPILLTSKQGLTSENIAYIKKHIVKAKVLGGESVVSNTTYQQIAISLKK